ncbi:MAG: sporulation integral membrane protein YtvI [Hominilimicola sp.]
MKIKKSWIKILLSVIGLAAAVALVYLFLPKILDVLGFLIKLFMPFLLGYLFSMAVNPLADFLQKKLKIPRGFSAVLVMVLIIGIVGGVLTFAIWKIVDEVRMLYTQFPAIYESVQNGVHSVGSKLSVLYDNLPVNVQAAITALGDSISDKAAHFINTKSMPVVDYAGNFAKALPSVFIGIVVFILSSYFMVSDNKSVSRAVRKIISPKLMNRLTMVKTELKKYLGGYCKAQIILMFIAFLIMLIGLSILNIDYALLIALAVAVLDALPFFGSGLVLWPWTVLAFLDGDIRLGIGLIIIYAAVALMRHFTEPKLVSSRIGMNPILTLMSMYVGYRTLSIGGLILGPIILMLIISFYKAGVFDAPIRILKSIGTFIKKQCITFKNFLVNLMESDWDE